jgi:hypothetical protein
LKLATIADFMSGSSARAESEIATSQQGAEGASFAVECTALLPALASTPVLLSASPSSSEPPPKPKENVETSAMLPVQRKEGGSSRASAGGGDNDCKSGVGWERRSDRNVAETWDVR